MSLHSNVCCDIGASAAVYYVHSGISNDDIEKEMPTRDLYLPFSG